MNLVNVFSVSALFTRFVTLTLFQILLFILVACGGPPEQPQFHLPYDDAWIDQTSSALNDVKLMKLLPGHLEPHVYVTSRPWGGSKYYTMAVGEKYESDSTEGGQWCNWGTYRYDIVSKRFFLQDSTHCDRFIGFPESKDEDFLIANEYGLWQLYSGQQQPMNYYSSQIVFRYRWIMSTITDRIIKYGAKYGIDTKSFAENQQHWLDSVRSECSREQNQYSGGTIASLVGNTCSLSAYRDRINALVEILAEHRAIRERSKLPRY